MTLTSAVVVAGSKFPAAFLRTAKMLGVRVTNLILGIATATTSRAEVSARQYCVTRLRTLEAVFLDVH
jgi:hypothetical protein